jgi:ABC-type microcin C transport system duplicated ATPase subunit YejF
VTSSAVVGSQHQYTQTLLDALPDINYSAEHEKLAAPEILKLTGFKVHYPIRQGLFKRIVDRTDTFGNNIQDQHTRIHCGKRILKDNLHG